MTEEQAPSKMLLDEGWGTQTQDGQVLLSMPWETFVLGISLLSLANLGLLLWVDDPGIRQVVVIMVIVLSLVFAADFVRRLHVARDNSAYFVHGRGWLDLCSIVPMLQIARLLRIARVIHVMRQVGGGRAVRLFYADPATGGLISVVLLAIMVFEFGAIALLWAEGGARGANIVTGVDSLWYLMATMSTVGYGDTYPVTDLGRLIGSIIIIVGVALFGTLTGYLANIFLAPSRR